jgi:hypothetical protein
MVQAAGTTGNIGLNVVERAVLAAASAPAGTFCPCARARRARGVLTPKSADSCRPPLTLSMFAGTPLYCTIRPEEGQGSTRQLHLTKTATTLNLK